MAFPAVFDLFGSKRIGVTT